MIRYKYNDQHQPPAPYVLVTLRPPLDGKELVDVPALIDTGADRTVLPELMVRELGLVQLDEQGAVGFGGVATRVPTFAVRLQVHRFQPLLMEILGQPGEPYILLGRNVLNHFRIVLDGPGQAFEID